MVFKKQKSYVQAFTIVELLIVIVIIGILAAITMVSYRGITARANESTIQADLATAKKQFELYYADHGAYPTSLENVTNCLKGSTLPSPDKRYCLKSSGDGLYQLMDATGNDYTLKLTRGAIAYKITKDLSPTSTTAIAIASSFAKTWGGASYDYGEGVVSTSDGGYATVGQIMSYGTGGYDTALVKYDASGNLSWNKIWGGNYDDKGFNLIQTSDGGYAITGHTTSYGVSYGDMFIAKFDASGNLSWNKTWGGNAGDDYGYSIIQTNDDGYAITGSISNGYGTSDKNVFLVKFDSEGSFVWDKTWGGAGDDQGYSLVQSSDGGYAVAGYTNSYGAGSYDMFLVKYDAGGNIGWSKTWGGTNDDRGYSLVQSSDGGYAITGYTSSYGSVNGDMFIAKFDASGNLSWNKVCGGSPNSEEGRGIAQSNDGGFIVTSSTGNYGAGITDVLLIKYDINGKLSWSKTWGGSSWEHVYGLAKTNDDGYVIAGETQSYGAGAADMFLAKTNASGNINNCLSPMCTTPTVPIITPAAIVNSPSVATLAPIITVKTLTATVSSPTAIETVVVAP